jgi:hypothetical protein
MSLIENLKKCNSTYQRAPRRARLQKKEFKEYEESKEFKKSGGYGS